MDRFTERNDGKREELERSLTSFLTDERGLAPDQAKQEAEELMRDTSEKLSGLFPRRWWVLLLRGLLGVLVGAMFLYRPGPAMAALVLVLGAWIFVDGVIALVAAIASASRRSWALALSGLIGIGIGYLVLSRPSGAAVVFYVLAAVWAMARGIAEISYGAGARRGTPGQTGVIAVGILSFLFGIVMLFSPLFGVVGLTLVIGLYAIIYGVMLIALSFRVRKVRKLATEVTPPQQWRGPAQPQPT